MDNFPGTPQTLPCSDEDPFFGFHEDSSVDNDSIGVNIGESTSSAFDGNARYQTELSLSHSSQSPHRPKDFQYPDEDTASIITIEKQQKDDDHGSKSCTFHESTKKKRRQYGSKLLSRRNLSKMFKAAVQPPSKPAASPNRSRWHKNTRNSLNDKYRLYHHLEDEEESRDLENLEDDRSSAVSLPVFSSLSRKMKSSSDAMSSASTSAMEVQRASKLRWNQLLKTDSLATFRKSESCPTAESTTSSSVVSSISSCYSAPVASGRFYDSGRFHDGGAKGFFAPSSHHVPLSREQLLNSRFDEDEEEDTDVEDDDHPAAGSFAFAIGRGEC